MPRTARLYLAGPDVFASDAKQRGEILKGFCRANGAEGVFPLDDDPAPGGDLAVGLREVCMEMIRRCDGMVANMDPFRGPGMDGGTAYEMGVAAALDIPVVGYTSDPRSYAQKVSSFCPTQRREDGKLWDVHGMQVEDYGDQSIDNLMMAKGVMAVFPSAEEAIAYLADKILQGRV